MAEVTLTGPKNFWHQDTWKTVQEELYNASDALGQIEQFNVSERTPILTGALISGISYEKMKSPTDKVLAFIYADVSTQEDEYERVYDIYVEGGSLGAGSNNGAGNQQMFGKMFTDDLGAITQWGEDALDGATNRLASGKGVPYP